MAIKIPIFLSAPTSLSPLQVEAYELVKACLEDENLQGRALGRTDFPKSNPLSEVLYIARSCFGGIILGFQQTWITTGFVKINTTAQASAAQQLLPTPWNQIEVGMLFALGKPIAIFREEGVTGGIFDTGSSDNYIIKLDKENSDGIREGIKTWASDVKMHYRR